MPRSPRVAEPGCVYHVMARGNGGEDLVTGPGDWKRLLAVIGAVKASSDFKLYAYCLMTNHFHALIRVGADPLAHFMQRIQTTWAVRFNLARKRRGHVFQGRFKSKPCGDDTDYCRWLLRYIHVNPVNAGLVARPEDWPWSSYRQFLGRCGGMADIDWPLSLFEMRLSAFADFVMQGIGETAEPDRMEDGRATPDPSEREAARPRRLPSFESLAQEVADERGVALGALLGGSRVRIICQARRGLVRRAVALGYRGTFLARRLGVTTTAISQMMRLPENVSNVGNNFDNFTSDP